MQSVVVLRGRDNGTVAASKIMLTAVMLKDVVFFHALHSADVHLAQQKKETPFSTYTLIKSDIERGG